MNKDMFERVEKAMRNSPLAQRTMRARGLVAVEAGELTLLIDSKKNYIPRGIFFELFGRDFFLEANGTVTVDLDDDAETILEIVDYELLDRVADFLEWRIEVLSGMVL